MSGVLAVPLSLGDRQTGVIEDVEALVNKVVNDRMRKWPRGTRTLNSHQRSDLVSYLIGVCWELTGRYDPKKDKSPNLAAYCARILNLRIADWYRQTFGDTRHGDKPIVLSLDAPPTLESGLPDAEGADRLVDTLPASTGDPALDRAPDLVGVLHGRGGSQPGSHDPVGEPSSRRATKRARRATARGGLSSNSTSKVKTKPRVLPRGAQPLPRVTSRQPVCTSCYPAFLHAFTKVNAKVAEAERLTSEQLEAKAAKRAQAVRFGSEWACPRCTKLADEQGHELMLQQAYPNRSVRRAAAGGSTSRKTKSRQTKRAK